MVLICAAAFVASALTFVSGFGLGTLLTPVFALFFPIQTAIAATALVHLANNLFKLLLTGRAAAWRIVLRFGLPATVAAVAGAATLVVSTGLPPLLQYEFAGEVRDVTPVKVLVGALTVAFAVLESSTRVQAVQMPIRYLPWGGALAGFLGGLSGIQGALRSAFLIRVGLSKETFVATGVVCAVLVDVARLLVYGGSQLSAHFEVVSQVALPMVGAATSCAVAGAFVGARLLRDMTLKGVQRVVSTMLIVIGLALGIGLL